MSPHSIRLSTFFRSDHLTLITVPQLQQNSLLRNIWYRLRETETLNNCHLFSPRLLGVPALNVRARMASTIYFLRSLYIPKFLNRVLHESSSLSQSQVYLLLEIISMRWKKLNGRQRRRARNLETICSNSERRQEQFARINSGTTEWNCSVLLDN